MLPTVNPLMMYGVTRVPLSVARANPATPGHGDPAPPSATSLVLWSNRGGRCRRRGDRHFHVLQGVVVLEQLLGAERLAVELGHELLVLDVDVVHTGECLVVDLREVDWKVVEEP